MKALVTMSADLTVNKDKKGHMVILHE